MKIFSQATACALVAVVNGLSIAPGTPRDVADELHRNWLRGLGWPSWQEPQILIAKPEILIAPTNPAPLYKDFQLYGGWDLPVPEPSADEFIRSPGAPYIADERKCYMSLLPRRGQTGEMKRVKCWSDELSAFRNGNGPTGFTGFFSSVGWPRGACYLVKDGKMIRLMENCELAIKNTNDNRFIQEDISGGEWGEKPIGGDKYFY